MRICAECKQEKSLTEFYIKSTAKGTYRNCCKSCCKIQDALAYKANQNKRIVQNRERAKRTRDEISELKRNNPCVDCGQSFHPAAMHFDHLPGHNKIKEISNLVGRWNFQRIMTEIAKCDLVCANCHAVRTYNRLVLSP